jgi:hypothetical protein
MSEIYWVTRMKENRRDGCNEFPWELGIWVPRDLSVGDASNTNFLKKGSSEFEAGCWIDIEVKAKEAKRKHELSLVASTQKLWYLRGSLWNGTKTQNGKLSGSAFVVVSIPP